MDFFSQIYILSSLKAGEAYTAYDLAKFIETERNNSGFQFDLRHIEFDGIEELTLIFGAIQQEIDNGEIPLIHFECHGDQFDGLVFRDGTEITWHNLSKYLLSINIATKFNLLVCLAACFGAFFIEYMRPSRPCPCWAVVAPTDEVHPGQVMSGFRKFYSALLRTRSVNEAQQALRTAEGRWFLNNAEFWYLEVVQHYVENQCTPHVLRSRIASLHKKLKDSGSSKSMPEVKAHLKQQHQNDLTYRFFDQYFSIEKIPSNKARFEHMRKRVRETIERLRSTGKYWI